jgi:NAD(P)-dependent dehydrogenase (short-subunit alcohol dehydrogenase family)
MDVVIVTGAAGGIGSIYVKALAEAGYGVVAADLQPPCSRPSNWSRR